MRKFVSLLFLAFLFYGQAFAQLSQCTITATVYTSTGAVASGVKIVVVRVVKNGVTISSFPTNYTTNSSGIATITAPRASTIYVYAPAYGLDRNGSAGVALSVPNSATANLEDLANLATVFTTLGDTLAASSNGVPVRIAPNTSTTLKLFGQIGNGSTSNLPGWFTLSGSGSLAITTDNTAKTATFSFTASSSDVLSALGSQTANTVLAGPTTGSAATASFRALVAADIPNLASIYQPLDSDLTSIAALSTTSFGRGLLTETNASTTRTTLGLVIGTDVAAIASPAFTGNPTAPTQSAGNNSTRIATTAYVDTAVAGVTIAEISQANAIDRASSTTGTVSGRRLYDAIDRWTPNIHPTTKAGHGFAVLDGIYNDSSGIWQKALAASASTLPTAIVTKVIDANTFEYATSEGEYTITGHGLSSSNVYYLQDAGGLGTSPGTVSYVVGAPNGADSFQYYGIRSLSAVSSVFGRTGAVVATTNDYTWAQINKSTSSLADITTRSASDLSSGTLAAARGGAGTVSGVLKANGSGVVSAAVSGTDYEAPLTFSTGLTRSTNTITVNTSQNIATLSNLTSNGFVKTSGGTGALSVDTTSYANAALSNLASVSINASLVPQANLDLGGASNPWMYLYFFGNGTYGANNFKLSGTPTAPRTITFPDASLTVARIDAAQTFSGVQTFDTIPIITNAAPGLTFTDTTGSAKSLTVAVDANLAQFRESAGASGSLMVLDLTNNRVGIGTTSPGAVLQVAKDNVIGAVASGIAASNFSQSYISGVTNTNKRIAMALDTTNNYGVIAAYEAGTAWYDLYLGANNSTGVPILGIKATGLVGIGTTAPAATLHTFINNSTTNAVDVLSIIGHDSTGTTAAGFGSATKYQLESSTTAAQDAAQIAVAWKDATHASRTSLVDIYDVYNAGALGRIARFNEGRFSLMRAGDANPATTELTSLGAASIYVKGSKFVIAYNNAGVITYITIPLDGSTATWTHGTSAP